MGSPVHQARLAQIGHEDGEVVAISRGRLKAGPMARAERTIARSRSFRFAAARKMAQLFRIADDINNSHPVAIEFEGDRVANRASRHDQDARSAIDPCETISRIRGKPFANSDEETADPLGALN